MVVLSHYYCNGTTTLSVDDIDVVGQAKENLVPTGFHLTNPNGTSALAASGSGGDSSVDVRDMFVYRSGLNSDELQALRAGVVLQASLEVYAPLDSSSGSSPATNLAQSMATVEIYS